jgi:hypothetical protein
MIEYCNLRKISIHDIKWEVETGNLTKRQQPNQRADNGRRSPMGLQCSEKNSALVFSS